ncbi:MAG: SseB family protein [Pseudomonadota bacterium]
MTETALDRAHAAMEAAPENDAARLRFYERLSDAELFLLLETPAQEDAASPQSFEIEGQSFVLAFDREERLAAFAGAAPYLALSGRRLVALLAAEGSGLGLNLEVAPSAFLLGPEGVGWLAGILSEAQAHAQPLSTEAPLEVFAPRGVPDALLLALDQKLAIAEEAARSAYLVGVRYRDGRLGHVLAIVDVAPGAETALSQAVAEALVFSGVEAGTLDVSFVRAADQITARFARHGVRFDLPELVSTREPEAPGMDPSRPPRLRR